MSNKNDLDEIKFANNTFYYELQELINKHCKESDSNTPDFILADYLKGCLKAFNRATIYRDAFYGHSKEGKI